jgi:adenylate cyclase
MKRIIGTSEASDPSSTFSNPLQYQNRLRFPEALEAAYQQDYAERVIVMQRQFIAFGFVIFGMFAILDYFAMPRTRELGWLLRGAVEPFPVLLFWLSYKAFWRRKMPWLVNLWMLAMSCAILVMIMSAQESELAFTFYPIGLMLVLICGYVASGHFWYATAQGWLAIIGYLLVGIIDQRMLVGNLSQMKFFTLTFFLVGMNLVGMVLGYVLERTNRLAFLQRLVIDRQHQESNRLLLNVLPESVAERLKRGEAVADHFDQVGILFADIQGFTPYSADKRPAEVVTLLNQIFSDFDALTEQYGLEKIKTIGDAYMVVSGLQASAADHLHALANMAIDMHAAMGRFHGRDLCNLQLRIGIHAGPVVAGIIGFKKFSYDLWGDTVNVASRMESSGMPGEIQVTKDVYHLLKQEYTFQRRGVLQIKGKGEMLVYLLKGRRQMSPEPAGAAEPMLMTEGAD